MFLTPNDRGGRIGLNSSQNGFKLRAIILILYFFVLNCKRLFYTLVLKICEDKANAVALQKTVCVLQHFSNAVSQGITPLLKREKESTFQNRHANGLQNATPIFGFSFDDFQRPILRKMRFPIVCRVGKANKIYSNPLCFNRYPIESHREFGTVLTKHV